MRRIRRYGSALACLAALDLMLGGLGKAKAEVINPSDAHGIRQLPGQNPFLLNFLSINHSVEDRTVIEFALRGLSGPVASATLDLGLRNLDPGLSGIINVFTFGGTGTVTPDLFSAGSMFASFANSESGLEHLDVTAAVLAAQQAGEEYIGFRLSSTTDSRYLLGPPFTQAGPTLTAEVVPEPSTLILLAFGVLGLFALRLAATSRVLAHTSKEISATSSRAGQDSN